MALPQRVVDEFKALIGEEPTHVVRAPGRVNLIGEHTDYNDGFVLPLAIGPGTDVAARRRGDGILRAVARRLGAEDACRVADVRPGDGEGWARYVRGCAAVLRDRTGADLPAADLVVDGD